MAGLLKECADSAAGAVVETLRSFSGGIDKAVVADVIEQVLNETIGEPRAGGHRFVDLRASMEDQLSRLLDASPAVIYSFKARDDFTPIFVSRNIFRLFGYSPREYLEDPTFWREHVRGRPIKGRGPG
jgi:hypothetical protein